MSDIESDVKADAEWDSPPAYVTDPNKCLADRLADPVLGPLIRAGGITICELTEKCQAKSVPPPPGSAHAMLQRHACQRTIDWNCANEAWQRARDKAVAVAAAAIDGTETSPAPQAEPIVLSAGVAATEAMLATTPALITPPILSGEVPVASG